ncbi:hypothetical protein ACIRU3_20860 [Streptomyces sp. NPDC101151]|uniref:hypothetical protein n=1 Tax=Streptomyces sp. NPDC101151 TaxID=3366115 RepID=UPI00380FB20C
MEDRQHQLPHRQLQASGLMTAAVRNSLIGAVDPGVSVPGVRHAVRGFLARHLAAP